MKTFKAKKTAAHVFLTSKRVLEIHSKFDSSRVAHFTEFYCKTVGEDVSNVLKYLEAEEIWHPAHTNKKTEE